MLVERSNAQECIIKVKTRSVHKTVGSILRRILVCTYVCTSGCVMLVDRCHEAVCVCVCVGQTLLACDDAAAGRMKLGGISLSLGRAV